MSLEAIRDHEVAERRRTLVYGAALIAVIIFVVAAIVLAYL